jgi:flagellar FliL protein
MKGKAMSDVETPEEEAPPPKPKRRGRKLLLLGLGLIVLGGVGFGATYLAQSAGLIHLEFGEQDPDRPRLVARDNADGAGFALRSDEQQRPDPRRHKASYYPIAKEFTSNLSESESFVQVGLGVSTYYDERVFINLQRHEMAVRSAVLMTLAGQDPAELTTPAGKLALQDDLKKAINDVLRAKEGFGGIDGVYFTSFVTQ